MGAKPLRLTTRPAGSRSQRQRKQRSTKSHTGSGAVRKGSVVAETLNEASPAPHDKDATEPRLQHLESNLATYHVNGSNIIAGESGDEDGVLNDEAAAGGLPYAG